MDLSIYSKLKLYKTNRQEKEILQYLFLVYNVKFL